MINLAGLSQKEIEEIIAPLPKFRAKQIYNWIIRGAKCFEEMTDLPSALRIELNEKHRLYSSKLDSVHDDLNTKKIVLALEDGAKIEAVLLNDGKDRYTACLSTQVGCPAACVFCKTGTLGFKRNLTCNEIVEQLLHLNCSLLTANCSLSNIVIMGMGEPLLNLQELRKAITYFTDKQGMNFSRRRITVSTCGISECLFDLANNGPYIRLALSLTTGCEELRQKLMPITKYHPLLKIKEGLLLFQKNGGSRITLEIPLLGRINMRKEDTDSIFKFTQGLDCVINVIPWNPVNGLLFNGKPLAEPGKKEIADYIKMLENLGLKVTVRYKKGCGISGACGQLGALE